MRVLIYGLAKTGTTILAARVQASLEEFCGREVTNSFEPKQIWRLDGKVEYIKGEKRQRSVEDEVVKTLFDSGVPAEEILKYQDHFDKKIFITRDPRDRYISQVFYRWHAGHNPNEKKFRKTLDLAMLKESSPESVPFVFLANQNPAAFPGLRHKLAENYEPVIEFLKGLSKDWYVVRYEDFVDGRLGGLEEYLGFPIKQEVGVADVHKRVARSKSHSNWRRWFTSEDVEYLKPAFQKYLSFAGYDVNDWRLEHVASLPKSEGSDYMKKLYSGMEPKKANYSVARSYIRRSLKAVTPFIHKMLQSGLRYKFFPRVERAEPRLFLHIPKTAGSSFRESLRLSVGDGNLFKDYPNRKDHQSSAAYEFLTKCENPSGFKDYLSAHRNAWVAGHVHYSRYSDVIPPENTFAFVRHPVERLLSSYKHKCRHKGLKISFEEFVEQDLVHNKQSKYLPLDYVSKLAFVGLTEEYGKSIAYLNWRYGLNLVEVHRQVAPRTQKVQIDKNLFDRICEKNSDDLALYQAAEKLFWERIKEMNSDLKNVSAAQA